MKYYNDKDNQVATKVMFIFLQMFMLLIVYGFVYTSLVAVKLAVAKYHLTLMAYMPVVFVMFAYPVVLYKTRRMFQEHKRLRAIGWMLGWAALAIVFLYTFLSQLVAV
ncbi:hypothetical protein [Sulfurovum sp.]|uniref:hypothetical protein n=1 Tax=Sulfurovum sp. TaxID=1969726 RepID=UPI0025E765CE|nr:hypothetical protein [Sulfurovum sp.]